MRVALISSKGGTGKTTVAVALASYWAYQTSVLLADCDPQDIGAATWWLDRTEHKSSRLSWVKTTAGEVADALTRINTEIVVVDTRPSIQDQDLVNVASAVDLVVVPGSAYESGTIAQTAITIMNATDTPCVAVLTKTSTQSAESAAVKEMTEALAAANCPIVGKIRRYVAMEAAPMQRRRPGQLTGSAGDSIRNDIKSLAGTIQSRIENR